MNKLLKSKYLSIIPLTLYTGIIWFIVGIKLLEYDFFKSPIKDFEYVMIGIGIWGITLASYQLTRNYLHRPRYKFENNA